MPIQHGQQHSLLFYPVSFICWFIGGYLLKCCQYTTTTATATSTKEWQVEQRSKSAFQTTLTSFDHTMQTSLPKFDKETSVTHHWLCLGRGKRTPPPLFLCSCHLLSVWYHSQCHERKKVWSTPTWHSHPRWLSAAWNRRQSLGHSLTNKGQ